MKTNGWQRIGIVASVVWVIGAGIYTLNRVSNRDNEMQIQGYISCTSVRDETDHGHRVDCERRSEQAPMKDMVTAFEACISQFKQEWSERDRECKERITQNMSRDSQTEREAAAFVALVPVPFAWGFIYLVVFMVRWVRRGFHSTD